MSAVTPLRRNDMAAAIDGRRRLKRIADVVVPDPSQQGISRVDLVFHIVVSQELLLSRRRFRSDVDGVDGQLRAEGSKGMPGRKIGYRKILFRYSLCNQWLEEREARKEKERQARARERERVERQPLPAKAEPARVTAKGVK